LPIILIIFACIIILYGCFTTIALIGFIQLRKKNFFGKEKKPSPIFISIVASLKNESKNIKDFINEIDKQTFSKENYELIIINDFSSDNTEELLHFYLQKTKISFQIISQPTHKGKKKNMALAISKAKGNIIITTDGDVIERHPDWLKTIAEYFKNQNCSMLIMPIDYIASKGLLSQFQIIENIALTAINIGYSGIGKPFMCNGANLAFRKTSYDEVNGYESHFHVTSGEDVLLLEDFKKINEKHIHYGFKRELIVKTKPIQDLISFISQRVRWAYKAKYNPNKLNLLVGLLVVSSNMVFLALGVSIIKQSASIPYLSIFAISKFIFDFLLLLLASDFLRHSSKLVWLIPFECLYWAYSFLIGGLSVFWKPTWKGEKIK
jgi:biofilm PGA synthesis N-glycosyltransferase PgaC